MQIEACNTFRVVSRGEEDPQPPLINLFIDQELGKAAVNLVLRGASVRTEQVPFAADRLLEGAFLLRARGCLGIAQLELLDAALDRPQNRQQMELLFD